MEEITVVKLTDPTMVRSPELRALSQHPKVLWEHPHVYQLMVNDNGKVQMQIVHQKKTKGQAYVKYYPVLIDAGILII